MEKQSTEEEITHDIYSWYYEDVTFPVPSISTRPLSFALPNILIINGKRYKHEPTGSGYFERLSESEKLAEIPDTLIINEKQFKQEPTLQHSGKNVKEAATREKVLEDGNNQRLPQKQLLQKTESKEQKNDINARELATIASNDKCELATIASNELIPHETPSYQHYQPDLSLESLHTSVKDLLNTWSHKKDYEKAFIYELAKITWTINTEKVLPLFSSNHNQVHAEEVEAFKELLPKDQNMMRPLYKHRFNLAMEDGKISASNVHHKAVLVPLTSDDSHLPMNLPFWCEKVDVKTKFINFTGFYRSVTEAFFQKSKFRIATFDEIIALLMEAKLS